MVSLRWWTSSSAPPTRRPPIPYAPRRQGRPGAANSDHTAPRGVFVSAGMGNPGRIERRPLPCRPRAARGTMRASDESHFDSRGPVGQYWLANGLDFTVCDGDGRRIGVVVHVVVDRRRQSAERLIVRRRGLVRRPRYVALNPHAVELVLPDSQLLLLAGTAAQQADRSPSRVRPQRPAHAAWQRSARAALAALVAVSLPVVLALDRRLAAAAEATLRLGPPRGERERRSDRQDGRSDSPRGTEARRLALGEGAREPTRHHDGVPTPRRRRAAVRTPARRPGRAGRRRRGRRLAQSRGSTRGAADDRVAGGAAVRSRARHRPRHHRGFRSRIRPSGGGTPTRRWPGSGVKPGPAGASAASGLSDRGSRSARA